MSTFCWILYVYMAHRPSLFAKTYILYIIVLVRLIVSLLGSIMYINLHVHIHVYTMSVCMYTCIYVHVIDEDKQEKMYLHNTFSFC